MAARQNIFRVRRRYNQWVANQTLEDYALRFTAKSARRWSAARVSNTALGAISFLALEAIGGSITLYYGFDNAVAAILAVSLVILLTAIPISYYAARYGVDIDLLTRGAGFGYIGSTITSLIYASFTFIFFAIEAAIMAMALEMLFDIPLVFGYLICAVVIIPLVIHGITTISRFQVWTQPVWVLLQLLPFVFIIYADASAVGDWTEFEGLGSTAGQGLNVVAFGAAAAVVFSLIAQIGEQVDFLRFIPEPQSQKEKRHWWIAVMAGGPGWIVIGALKILAGSFLAVLALNNGISASEAADPTQMYLVAFNYITHSPELALAMAGIFVILCQLKINVTNAYAGSIAWSNFFSRLTHSHPGRVVWLFFNVGIALLVMELGVYRALEETLGFYGIIAVAWIGALVADLVINKPLGLSPKHIEFKRAHLYDINPVGVGAMLAASVVGIICHTGAMGQTAQALSHFIAIAVALIVAPLIAWKTAGRFYIARPPEFLATDRELVQCTICEHKFEPEDITTCPAYAGIICSLCCSLDARCGDACKPGAGYRDQLQRFFGKLLPPAIVSRLHSRLGHFLTLLCLINGLSGLLLSLIHYKTPVASATEALLLSATLWKVFFILLIVTGVICWLFVLAHGSRVVAEEESERQTRLLMEEIVAHERTDQALQQAKEQAEAANGAKSRYLTGISHELRSPLNAILGYAQLLENDESVPAHRKEALGVIRRSSEYLADLIEGLLDISKIEAGRLDLHRDQVRIDLLMEQLVTMFRLQAEEKDLVFTYHCPLPLPERVTTDEKRLRQILINLLSNAIKYTDRGSVSLTLRYRSQVAEFTVRDTGEGIAPDNIERIFRPFERIRTPGQSRTGTGLGLTITRLLTEMMGGDIAVESEPGQGSVFKVSLMLSSLHSASPHSIMAPARRIYGYHGTRRKVLLVDDDASHRQVIRAMLSPLGFEVRDIGNALHVLETVKTERPDLILLDVSMPGYSGWEVLQQLRADQHSMPVVMVSADASEGCDRADSPQLNDGYIIKPVRLDLLLDIIAQMLALDWRFEKSAEPLAEIPSPETGTLALPDKAHRQELANLARIGHRKGLLEVLHGLKHGGEAEQPFIRELTTLTNDFQFEKILELLKVAEHETS
ncbi:ATP-binding protein [Marinobacter sp. BSs20148]|jgi:signal transduction histidine kinase/DNA-binding NarL/FixJ family response regulator|uniref:hybrid sensor histidine kinase/response regulator n=1 Tax=Marinobacter sp. BSs20148 TaxID=490759 RepID=UPI0002776F84|nr:ATP-binding protein [Marinobacter sp. BSs20148]AFP30121.1 integral membrane sensor hybrid histidine kinase [Marinobacter sp. BSs20148]